MRDTEIKREKAAALYALYKQGLEQCRFESVNHAAHLIVREPAPCFFISAKRAAILVAQINAHISLINTRPTYRRMAWQLWRNLNKYEKEHPDDHSTLQRKMEILVDEPAPEFYISPMSTRLILMSEIRKARRKYGW